MRILIQYIYKFILGLLGSLIPKNKKIIVFYSIWNTMGNAKILYDYIKQHNIENIKVYFFTPKDFFPNKKIIKNLYHLYRAKIIMSTHGSFPAKAHGQIHISLHHGTPIKSIGRNGYETKDNFLAKYAWYYKNIDYHITPTPLSALLFSYAWGIHPEKIKIIGEPMLDKLQTKTKSIENRIRNLKKNYSHIVLYAPTWRNKDDMQIFIDFVNEATKHKDTFTFICPHPKNRKYVSEMLDTTTHNNTEIYKGDTNDLIPYADSVIIDISSLLYYLLYLQKNFIVYFPDKQKYTDNFGIIMDAEKNILNESFVSKSVSEAFDKLLSKAKKEERLHYIKHLPKLITGEKHSEHCKKIYEFILSII